MNSTVGTAVLRYIRRTMGNPCRDRSDQELLQQFIASHDEEAFATLMDRHGPLVRGVCMRVLGNTHDADDAFQAAFLVLACKARSLRRQNSVGPFLYGVAGRIANKARAQAARRRHVEKQVVEMAAPKADDDLSVSELKQVLDEELQKLPQRYRAPLVLCCLEGKTRDEAAQQLGWAVGSLKGRLERGRELLRSRLARRGVALSTALTVLELQNPLTAAVPHALSNATLAVVQSCAASQPVAALVTPQVLTLARAALHGFTVANLSLAGSLWLTVSLFIGGVIWVANQSPEDPQPANVIPPAVVAEEPLNIDADEAVVAETNITPSVPDAPAAIKEKAPVQNPPPKSSRSRALAFTAGSSNRAVNVTITEKNGQRRVIRFVDTPQRID